MVNEAVVVTTGTKAIFRSSIFLVTQQSQVTFVNEFSSLPASVQLVPSLFVFHHLDQDKDA